MVDRLLTTERDEQQAELLAAFDESLRRGEDPDSWSVEFARADTSGSLQHGFDCLRLLERAYPRRAVSTAEAGELQGKRIGRFTLERMLGYGGFGIVYLAEDPLLRRKVALKIPRAPMLVEERQRARFLREAQSAAALNHPNLIPVYEAGEADGVCYIVAEYCSGPSLVLWLREQGELAGGQRPAERPAIDSTQAATIIRQLADAVQHAHDRGVLHRDIKPANVLLEIAREGDSVQYKPRLTDFGLARVMELDDSFGTATGMILGTPQYMAPEQAAGRRELYGPATDVYGLGVLLYELLTGRPPIAAGQHPAQTLQHVLTEEPTSPRKLAPSVPSALEAVALKCLAKEPRKRYATATELAADLERFLQGDAVLARATTALDRMGNWCRHPARITLAGIVTLIFGVLGFVWCGAIFIAVFSGAVPLARPTAGIAYGATVMFGLYLPWVWLGWKIVKRQAWALWITATQGLLLSIFGLVHVTRLYEADLGGMYEKTPDVRWGFESFFLLLVLAFTLTQILGLLAYYAQRPAIELSARGANAR